MFATELNATVANVCDVPTVQGTSPRDRPLFSEMSALVGTEVDTPRRNYLIGLTLKLPVAKFDKYPSETVCCLGSETAELAPNNAESQRVKRTICCSSRNLVRNRCDNNRDIAERYFPHTRNSNSFFGGGFIFQRYVMFSFLNELIQSSIEIFTLPVSDI